MITQTGVGAPQRGVTPFVLGVRRMVRSIRGFLMICSFAVSSVAFDRTIWVAQDGSGDFLEVFQAVQAAQPGDTVQVEEGIFYGAALLDKPIVLRGAGAEKTSLLSLGDVVTVKAEGCVIEGLTLAIEDLGTGSVPKPVAVVHCVSSSPSIRQNTFGGGGSGFYEVLCEGNSSPVIAHNNFQIFEGGYGVYLKDAPRGGAGGG